MNKSEWERLLAAVEEKPMGDVGIARALETANSIAETGNSRFLWEMLAWSLVGWSKAQKALAASEGSSVRGQKVERPRVIYTIEDRLSSILGLCGFVAVVFAIWTFSVRGEADAARKEAAAAVAKSEQYLASRLAPSDGAGNWSLLPFRLTRRDFEVTTLGIVATKDGSTVDIEAITMARRLRSLVLDHDITLARDPAFVLRVDVSRGDYGEEERTLSLHSLHAGVLFASFWTKADGEKAWQGSVDHMLSLDKSERCPEAVLRFHGSHGEPRFWPASSSSVGLRARLSRRG